MMQIWNPKWHDRDHSMIELLVDFEDSHGGRVPAGTHKYIASKNDPHQHGRSLFERAEAGEFGRIAEWGV